MRKKEYVPFLKMTKEGTIENDYIKLLIDMYRRVDVDKSLKNNILCLVKTKKKSQEAFKNLSEINVSIFEDRYRYDVYPVIKEALKQYGDNALVWFYQCKAVSIEDKEGVIKYQINIGEKK